MCPSGTQLQKYKYGLDIDANKQQACCPVETPMARLASFAQHPSITISKSHEIDVATGTRVNIPSASCSTVWRCGWNV
jgi:hypothetical protein